MADGDNCRMQRDYKESIMKTDTDTIDMLFLELSQFSKATTRRERELIRLNAELLKALNDLLDNASSPESEKEIRVLAYARSVSSKANKLI